MRFRAPEGGRAPGPEDLERVDVFYSNYYCGWNAEQQKVMTGICQSMGKDARGASLLTSEPVTVEALELAHDSKPDPMKLDFARAILDAAPTLEAGLKRSLLEKFGK
jgi:hypothetical protein